MGVGPATKLGEGLLLAGRYRLERKIGEGAFAAVWLATDHKNADLPVAIKVFQPTRRSRDPSYLHRFKQEAELLRRLHHDAIARALDTIAEDGLTAIVLEYVEGRSLRAELQRRAHVGEVFQLAEIGRVTDALLSALGHAHDLGAIHRDVKPANLVVRALLGSASSAITVLDFGVAKLVDLDAHEATTVGRMLGTISYMAPEQARAGAVDPRSDLFSVGVVLFELLTLRRLWLRDQADDPILIAGGASAPPNLVPAIVAQLMRGTRPPPSRYRDDVGPALDQAVLRALEVEPERRFLNAAEMRSTIVPLLGIELRPRLGPLVPPRLPGDLVPVVPSIRAAEQRVSGPWVGLAAPSEFLAPRTRRVGPLRREIQRFRHRRLAAALRASARFRHFAVDERGDELSVSGPLGSAGSDEVSDLRLTLEASVRGFRVQRAVPAEVVRTLEVLNGSRAAHVVLLSRLSLCFEDGPARLRAEAVAHRLSQSGGLAVIIQAGHLSFVASPAGSLDIVRLRAALDAFVEAGDLIALASAIFIRSEAL